MLPELFNIGSLHIYSYGVFIALGTYLAFLYMSKNLSIKLNIQEDEVVKFFLIVIIAAAIGGKILYYLEDLKSYIESPSKLLNNLGKGFVFYGSLIFIIPTAFFYFRKNNWPMWKTLDYGAIAICIVHFFGRIGCFLAGCCHGLPTDLPWGVTFSDPSCSASPLNTPLHPTQLYEVLMIGCIALILHFLMRSKRKSEGDLFLLYLVFYSIGRSIIEIFRGDEARGFLIDGWISHSQGISIIVILSAVIVFFLKGRSLIKE